jgi:hypothetical protein
MNHHQWVVAVVLASFGCKPAPGSVTSPSHPSAQILPKKPAAGASLTAKSEYDKILPDAAPPFAAAAPIDFGQGYIRRTYVSGTERVEITIARFGKDPGAFERWVAGSASYPQAQLSLPAAQGNGFFSCASPLADAACDLHIQLRSGFHVEVMGNGRVPRRNLIEFISYIQLGDLPASDLAAL